MMVAPPAVAESAIVTEAALLAARPFVANALAFLDDGLLTGPPTEPWPVVEAAEGKCRITPASAIAELKREKIGKTDKELGDI